MCFGELDHVALIALISSEVLREELHDPIKEGLSPELYDAGKQFRKMFIIPCVLVWNKHL